MIKYRQRVLNTETGETGIVLAPTPAERKHALRTIAAGRYDTMRHLYLINWDNGDPTTWEHDTDLEVLT